MTLTKHRFLNFLLIFLMAGLTGCSLFTDRPQVPEEPSVTINDMEEVKETNFDEYGFSLDESLVQEGIVKRNQSLYLILRDLDVSPQKIYEINREAEGVFRDNRVRPGQRFLAYTRTDNEQAVRLILHENPLDYVVFDWEEGIEVKKGKKAIEKKVMEASGVIQSSLYETLLENGHTTLLANRLSEVFAWQIDFFRLYRGDRFKVIYEQLYVDGEPYAVGDILAAEFVNKGEAYDAFYYESPERTAYYDSEGNGVQKALLKTPFKFSHRISSGFSYNRFHPVHKTSRPHYGVDYAAPLGTPVLAVGDGTITRSRYSGAAGNMVKIRHNGTFSTAYLHLNGFAKGIREGTKVKQGQVIGYVGRTGTVTGVHLDYRIYKNDTPVNPLRVKLPASKSIADSEKEAFFMMVEEYRNQLDSIPLEEGVVTQR